MTDFLLFSNSGPRPVSGGFFWVLSKENTSSTHYLLEALEAENQMFFIDVNMSFAFLMTLQPIENDRSI